jgi:hypothetical protein
MNVVLEDMGKYTLQSVCKGIRGNILYVVPRGMGKNALLIAAPPVLGRLLSTTLALNVA